MCVRSVFQDYQAIVDAEWNILYDKLEKIYKSGAKVVLSKLPIGDVATQYFADRDLFCAGRVQEEDLKRTMMVRKILLFVCVRAYDLFIYFEILYLFNKIKNPVITLVRIVIVKQMYLIAPLYLLMQ